MANLYFYYTNPRVKTGYIQNDKNECMIKIDDLFKSINIVYKPYNIDITYFTKNDQKDMQLILQKVFEYRLNIS
jgi:hypothetical protein